MLNFHETRIEGVWVVEGAPVEDKRGFFARSFSAAEFERRGLPLEVAECNVSGNTRAGTLRGLHYQAAPHAETKLVRVTRGRIYDVVLDLRPRSATYRQWISFELDARGQRMVYIAEGCAHGFQTLCDNTELFYHMSTPYEPAAARGVRWNDPRFGISWPITPPRVIAKRDAEFPDFSS